MQAFLITIVLVSLVAAYFAFIRPMLRQWKSLAGFWQTVDARELGLFGKLQALLDGVKIKLLARLVWVPAVIVQVYDDLGPYFAGADFTSLTSRLPPTAQAVLPIVVAIGVPILIDVARSYSSRAAG